MAVVGEHHSNGRCKLLLHVYFECQVRWCILYLLCGFCDSVNDSTVVYTCGELTHPFFLLLWSLFSRQLVLLLPTLEFVVTWLNRAGFLS